MLNHQRRLDQHAHGDEERRAEHVPERHHEKLEPPNQPGLRGDGADEKRAQREAEIQRHGEQGHAETERYDRDDAELLAPEVIHVHQKPRHDQQAQDHHDHEKNDQLPHLQQDACRLQFAGRRHTGQHGNERDGDDVFDDRRAENDMREILVHLVHVLERLREDGRGRIADDRAEEQARYGAEAERPAQFIADPQHDHDIQHGDQDGRRPRVPELAEVELQAEGKHQEKDADIGEGLRGAAVLNPRQRVRPDQDSGQHIAEDLRQLQALEQERRHAGRHHDNGQIPQYVDFAHAVQDNARARRPQCFVCHRDFKIASARRGRL